MTAPTAKIKALLATILQTVLDGNAGGAITTGTTTPPERTFVALLQAELLQRGVVVELPLSTTPTTTKTIATPATNGTSSSGKNTDHDTPLVPLLLVLLRAVQSNAGKSLLREDPSSTAVPPVPLLAGSAVIAGRLAEHLARVFLRMRPEAADAAQADFFAILRSTGSETEATATTELRDMVQSCQTRCREVEDLRFQELLRLMENPNAGDDEESKNGHTTSRAQAFFILAEGYYLRAAQFQPDTPAMWKKAWDCTTERKKVWLARQQPKQLSQDDTSNRDDDEAASVDWEAVTAVSNLRRIAMNKANAKRAAELSLVLTDCYLDALVQPSSRSSSSSGSSSSKTTVRTDTVGSSSSTFKTLLNTFVAPCRSIRPDWTLQQVVELALETLDVSNENEESASSLLSEGDQLYRLLLRLRVFGAQDDAATDAMAETDFARAKNRIEDTTKKTGKIATTSTKLSATPTLQKCWQDARQRHLANCQNSSARFESAVAIRHCLITQKSWNSAAPRIQNATWALLQRHIEWLQERAQVWGIVNSDMTGWSDVSDFAQPLLMHYISQFRNTVSGAESEHESVQTFINGILDSFSEEESCFIEEVCLASARLKWMLAGSLFTKFTDLSLHSMLKILEDRRKNAEKKEKAETINVIGTRSPENCNFIQLQSALAAVGALLVLDSPAEENDGLHRIADLATSRSAQIDVCSGEMGHAYLEFLVCWSGLHKTPWSHCSQPDARLLARKARASLDNAKSQWGRRISEAELVLFDLGEADIEGVVFDSGLVNEAIKKYKLLSAASEKLPDQFLADLVAVRCYSALAELSMRNHSGPSNVFESEPSMVSLARRGLERLETIPPIHSNQNVYFWSSSNFYESSIRFQIAKSRQLIADALLRSGDTTGAQSFLEDAVRDAPLNSSAAFSLGRFRLYVAVFGIDGSADSAKAAQVQLLRAAKLDPTKAGPFALLGYWYEGVKDNQRALGCYSKALQIDASHPVAGRGVIRLAPRELLLKAFDRATASSFAIVGWAWYAIGLQQAFVDGDDDLAIVSLLRAVRCRDIDRPEGEVLGAFFSDPLLPELPQHKELSSALAVLAACYRRLGRFTAALRSYHSAINEARDDISSALLCACAQVELELGLVDDAADKFDLVMTSGDVELFPVAAYGKGVALLSIAQRATQDGKIGLAYKILRHGLNEFSQPESAATVCLQKLKGDFYSFGATLPPSVFLDSTKYNNSSDSDGFLEKMEFISQGEAAYRCAHALIEGCSDESSALRAQLLTDIGSNYLLQAQIASGHESEGLGGRVSDVSSELFASAAKEFRLALEISPLFGLAWCGLGCALVRSDPLMAQHAFSRSMELDKLAPDSYANLSFLYTTHKNHGASALVSDALTEIADTPMMWINRALIFEYTASQQAEHMLECKYLKQAADAYRASMQTLKHPSATLGISLTCRIESNESDDMLMDSYNYASEYIGRVGSADLPAMLAEGVLSVEVAAKSTNDRFDQMLIEARQLLLHRIERVEECSMDNTEDQGIDLSLCRELVTKDVKNNEQQATDSKSVGSEWSIHRQVVNSPNRGDLWLRLAKQCALKASDEKEGSTGTALTAARRATSILMQQLAEPTTIPTKDRSTRVVKARDLSDALALRYWLEHISDSRKCGIPCDAEDLLPTIQAVNTLELQRSLIICPGNIMARQALLESIVK